jgi:hypothetical protein
MRRASQNRRRVVSQLISLACSFRAPDSLRIRLFILKIVDNSPLTPGLFFSTIPIVMMETSLAKIALVQMLLVLVLVLFSMSFSLSRAFYKILN